MHKQLLPRGQAAFSASNLLQRLLKELEVASKWVFGARDEQHLRRAFGSLSSERRASGLEIYFLSSPGCCKDFLNPMCLHSDTDIRAHVHVCSEN